VDLGAQYRINGFSLFLNNSIFDYPRNLKILGSPDGTNWRDIRATALAEYAWGNNRLIKRNAYRFDPLPIRYLKLIETGSDPIFWWSIYELEVVGPQVR
jgi:hypothetical protein